MCVDNLSEFIENVIKLPSFWSANYYLKCMKKTPHGGIENVNSPNYFMKHRQIRSFQLYSNYNRTIPYFLHGIVTDVKSLWDKSNVNMEELIRFTFNGDFWYPGYRVLKAKNSADLDFFMVISDDKIQFEEYFELDNIEEILCAFICYLIEEKLVNINSISDIICHERLTNNPNKYGLSLVNDANFKRQGFIIDNTYFLYNLFLNTSIGQFAAEEPAIITLFKQIPNVDIFMRCDSMLAVPKDKLIDTSTVDFEKFRGITVEICNIEEIVRSKEIVVHYNPKTMNKLLLIIKKDNEGDEMFYHIEFEELWNPNYIKDDIIELTYIHSKYFPERKVFTHIDFSVNQYELDTYKQKYIDTINDSSVPVDKYGDEHYKIWCVEGNDISIEHWSKLISLTLDFPFKNLFFEMFPIEGDLTIDL